MPVILAAFLKGLITAAAGSLANIFVKILMKGAAEEHLAKLFFFLADFFAKRTANTADDSLVKWAKSIYYDEQELKSHLNEVESASFILAANQEELK